jgi:RHS repeat-associated protein
LTNPFRYTGRDFDSETNLYYYRARYYDPAAGRFLSEDPIGTYSVNKYVYVRNNPVNRVDPSGLVSTCAISPNDRCRLQCDIAYGIKLTICALLFESGPPALLCATGATIAWRVCVAICDHKYPK